MMRVGIALLLAGLLYGLGWAKDQDEQLPQSRSVAFAQSSCVPRPSVQVRVQNDGPDVLWITVSAQTPIVRMRFGVTRYARLDIPGGPADSSGNVDLAIASPMTRFRFIVRRDGGEMNVPFTVVDGCGPWQTFIGGGMAVGQPTPTPTPTPWPTPLPFNPLDYIGQGDRYGCADFWSQANAQAVLRSDPTDPNRLDTNPPDGLACGGIEAAADGVPGGFMAPPFDGVRVHRP